MRGRTGQKHLNPTASASDEAPRPAEDNRMASLTLEQFRDAKRRGFPGWQTAVVPGYEGARPYVDPVDARYGAPSFPFGADLALAGPAFEGWCAENLVGDYYLVAGTFGGLVYCQLDEDAGRLRGRYAARASDAPRGA
jgi:hypothetical protein